MIHDFWDGWGSRMASLTWESHAMELPRRKPVEKPAFRLRTRLVFWRLAFLIFLVMELVLWLKVIRPNVPFSAQGQTDCDHAVHVAGGGAAGDGGGGGGDSGD